MKIVKIIGGLGNQMFQYAFARALEYKLEEPVYLDISSYQSKAVCGGIDMYHNGFELERVFAADFKRAPPEAVKRLSTQPVSFLKRFRRKYLTKKSHYIDKAFAYTEEVFKRAGDCYFEGYWQSEKYFSQIRETIINDFAFALPLSAKNSDLLDSITRPAASVHVRRGDYLKSENLNVCTQQYFYNALEYARSKKEIQTVLVFSDDIDWCKRRIYSESETIYVDWNVKEESWQDMALMSACECNIIANSSFSWWAAYLNRNKNKLVIAPKPWNMREARIGEDYYKYNFSDIIPSDWIRQSI